MQVIPVKAPVDRVTVYRNGALVVRRGEGGGVVEVSGLPLLFSSDSLRVRPARGTVLDLAETVRLETRTRPPPPDDEKRTAVMLRMDAVDDELRSVEVLLDVADGLVPVPPDPKRAPDTVDPARFIALLRFGQGRAEPLQLRRAELREERRTLERELHELNARAHGEETPPVATRGVRFTLPEPCAFELEYFVAAARWVPSYTLHLSGARAAQGQTSAHASLVCGALVAQASGEDWSGAALAVCTAELARESTLPTLSSWRMGRAQAPSAKAWRPLPSDLPTLFAGYDRGGRATRDPDPSSMPPEALGGASFGSAGSTKFTKESTGSGFSDISSAEVRSFEQQKAFVSERQKSVSDDDFAERTDAFGAEVYSAVEPLEGGAAPDLAAAPMPVMAPPSMARAAPKPSASNLMAKRRSAPMAPGGGGGARPEPAAREPLPARFRTAYMRMAGADEPMRGQLLPLAPLDRLAWLLDAHDVDDDGRLALGRAVRALQEAQARLHDAPLPHGTTALAAGHFFAVLSAADRTDVPGDGTFYRVEVRRDDGAAALEHRAVPRASFDVWRFCKLELKGAPLPAGPLSVYEDGTFRVSTRLDPTASARTLDVNLGVDPDVRVVGRTVHTEQQEKGLVSQTSRVLHRVKLEVRSARPEPVQLVILDRLPVPADNVRDVSVTVVEEKPPARRTNRDLEGHDVPGALEWRTTLMPGDLFVAQHAYAIDLPAKAELEGGNRRE